MKRFIKKITIYFSLLIVLGLSLQFIVDSGLQKCNVGNFREWNKILHGKIKSDIIVLGSSRALVQYDPVVIEDSTGLPCYNFGISGGRFVMQNAKWELYLKHNKPPRILIQNLDIIILLGEDHIFGKQQFYLIIFRIVNLLGSLYKK